MFKKQKLLVFVITIIFTLFFVLTQSVLADNSFVFNKDLKLGNVNNDVKELQKFLNNNGFVLNKSGIGSFGQETTFFGQTTKNAVIKFQKANKITPVTGYFGPISRGAINKILTSSTIVPNSLIDKVKVRNNQSVKQNDDQLEKDIKSNYYTIGGSITGIVGKVVLQNNGKDDLVIDTNQGSDFTFPIVIVNGASYSVTIKSKSLDQNCYVNNNIGVVSGENIKNIKIACGVNLFYNPFTFTPMGGGVTSYSLTYTSGVGGAISGSISQTVNNGDNGSSVTAVPDIGYNFVRWSDGVLTAERTDSSVTDNKSVSAIFVINTYTVTYNDNGKTGGTTPSNQTKTYNTALVLDANSGALVKTGYTLSGWNTLADGTGDDYALGANYTANANITLYAKWTINTYTVTFDINGGDGGSTATQTLNYNTPTTLTTNGFTRTGYTFAGWATTTDGIVGYANGASYTIGTENITLYAKWNPSLAVGDSYQGGKVAYIFQAGDPGYVAGETHGLIAATSNQSTGVVWAKLANQSTSVPGGTTTTLGSGSINTDNIIAQNGSGSTYAAGVARAYAGGDYHDWYLPSLDELTKLYISRAIIGGFTADYYWSSTDGGASSAWSKHFTAASVSNQLKSTQWTYVRAVRSF